MKFGCQMSDEGKLYLVCEKNGIRVMEKFTLLETNRIKKCINNGQIIRNTKKFKEESKEIPSYIG